MYVHACTYYTHTCVWMHVPVCIYAIWMCRYVYNRQMSLYMHACMHMSVYLSIYVCIWAAMYNIYTQT